MKDQVLHSTDDQCARGYAAQIHQLNHEPVPDDPKPQWRRRVAAGVIIGSIGYLLTSCFLAQQLHKPKIERARFRLVAR